MVENPEQQLKAVYNFLLQGKLRRAKHKIREAVGWVEVEWGGCTFHLFPKDNVSDRVFWARGVPDEQRSITQLLTLVEGKLITFWDIGANCGVYTVLVAKNADKNSRIFAFEPNPEMFDRLGQNIAANKIKGRVTDKNIALGEEPGELELGIHAGNLGRATLRTDDDKAPDRKITVPVEPINSYLDMALPDSLKVLKIDVEGFEDRVLMPWINSSKNLDEVDYLLIEHVHKKFWNTDVIELLTARGFRSIFVGEGNTLLASPTVSNI